MGTTLVVERLTKRYGTTTALDQVSVEVEAGEFFTLLGPSGCGKTTLLRCIAGFLNADGGRILCDGARLDRLPAHARDIGMVFQSYAIFPHLSVFENVAYGLRARRVAAGELVHRVREVLLLVQMDALAARMPHQLSGGQQQRVALARAMAIRPRLLLMDEPLSNLDARLRVEMRTEIRRLQRSLDTTTIYVTHDQEEALAISDRVAVMAEGRVQQIGLPWEVYERPRTAFVARFIGLSNALEGRVVERADGGVVLDVQGWRIAARGDAPGERLTAVIRPEAVSLVRDAEPPPGWNLGEGVVSSREYLGAILRYGIRVGAGSVIHADVHKPDPHRLRKEGEPVRIAFAPDDVLLYPAEPPR